jgi:hypothetical protein
MGTWGAGNFADDRALDWLGGFVDGLVDRIEEGMADPEAGCSHPLGAQLEALAVLCEQLNAVPPEPARVARWREKYVRTWDAGIDAYGPDPQYKADRRKVIEATFDRLAAVAERWHMDTHP